MPADSARLAATLNNTIVWYDFFSSAIPLHIGPTLSIAANPTNGMVTLTGVLNPKSAITLYNTLGKMVLKAYTPSSTIDLSHLPKGINFLTITNGLAHFSEKIVLQ